jgi:hypothetical protein
VWRLLLVTTLVLAAGGAAKAHAAFVQQAALTASDGAAGDAFGARVALSGNSTPCG